MKRLGLAVLFLTCLSLIPSNAAAQTKKPAPDTKAKAPLVVKVNAHSATITWVQSPTPTPPTGTTWSCPNGSANFAVTSNTLYRGTATGGETTYQAFTVPTTTYTDTSVTGGLTYFYQVTSTNCAGESARSVEASAAIPLNPVPLPTPPAPTNVTISNIQ